MAKTEIRLAKGPWTVRATWNDGIFEVARFCGDSRRYLGNLHVFGRRA